MGSSPDFSQPIKSQIRTEYRGVNVPTGKDQCPQALKRQNFHPGCSLVPLKQKALLARPSYPFCMESDWTWASLMSSHPWSHPVL